MLNKIRIYVFTFMTFFVLGISLAGICTGTKDCPVSSGVMTCTVEVPPGGHCVVDPDTGEDYIHCLSFDEYGQPYAATSGTCGDIWEDLDDPNPEPCNINDPFYFLYCDPFAY